jgi:hypothetical protein
MKPMFENVILITIGLFIFWQVVIPVAMSYPIFPMFRRGAKRRLKVAQQRYEEAVAEMEVAKLNAKTAEVRVAAAQAKATEESRNKEVAKAEATNKEPDQ